MVERKNGANRVPGTGKAPSVLLPVVVVNSVHRCQQIIWQQSGSFPDFSDHEKTPPLLLLIASINMLNPA